MNLFKSKIILGLFLALSTLFTPVQALADSSGDAVYRDGVTGGFDHAGILYWGRDGQRYVIEELGGLDWGNIYYADQPVTLDSWSTFLAGKNYLGAFYNPSYQPSSSIIDTAFSLTNNPAIDYTHYGQVQASDNNGSGYITVDEIVAMRCDGVVEYCYEWNNSWVWGRFQMNYDITNASYTDSHYNLGFGGDWYVSPYVQRGGSGTQFTQLRPR